MCAGPACRQVGHSRVATQGDLYSCVVSSGVRVRGGGVTCKCKKNKTSMSPITHHVRATNCHYL